MAYRWREENRRGNELRCTDSSSAEVMVILRTGLKVKPLVFKIFGDVGRDWKGKRKCFNFISLTLIIVSLKQFSKCLYHIWSFIALNIMI